MNKEGDNNIKYDAEITETTYHPFCCFNTPALTFSCFNFNNKRDNASTQPIQNIKYTKYHKGFSYSRNKWKTLWWGDIEDPEISSLVKRDNYSMI